MMSNHPENCPCTFCWQQDQIEKYRGNTIKMQTVLTSQQREINRLVQLQEAQKDITSGWIDVLVSRDILKKDFKSLYREMYARKTLGTLKTLFSEVLYVTKEPNDKFDAFIKHCLGLIQQYEQSISEESSQSHTKRDVENL